MSTLLISAIDTQPPTILHDTESQLARPLSTPPSTLPSRYRGCFDHRRAPPPSHRHGGRIFRAIWERLPCGEPQAKRKPWKAGSFLLSATP